MVWTHRTADRVWQEGLDDGGGPRTSRSHWLDMLFVLTRHQFRARYRAQALGVVWSLLHPLVMMGILGIVFSQVFRSRIRDFPIFLLIGLVVWQFISTTSNSATQVFVANAALIKNTVFPRHLLPLSLVLSLGGNFLLESMLLPLFIPIFPSAFRLTPALTIIPILVVCLAALLVGIAFTVSVLNVLYRDLSFVVSTGLLILYWLTPVIYSPSIVAEPYRSVLMCNPIGGILTALRGAIMLGEVPSLLGWVRIVVPTLLVLAIGWRIFKRYERMVLDFV